MKVDGCYVKISKDHPRAELWLKAIGSLEFPLKNPYPVRDDTGRWFYQGDLSALTPDKYGRLVSVMAEYYNKTEKEMNSYLASTGFLPIEANHTTVIWCQKHFYEVEVVDKQ